MERRQALFTRFHLTQYFVREALVSMARNKLMNAIAIGMIGVSLAIFGIFLIIFTNLNTIATQWSDSVYVIAYLRDNVTEEQRKQVEAQIRTAEYADTLVYVSPQEAMSRLKQRLSGREYLLEGVESNVLPASYEMKIAGKYQEAASVQKIVEALKNIPQIEDVQYGQQWLENLTILLRSLKFIGAFVGIFLFLTVVFIISNTIKLALYTREEEVDVMKFLGATESFIKGPFLTEGMIRGFLGAVLSLVLLYGVHSLFLAIVRYSPQSFFTFSSIAFLSWTMMAGIALFGSFLGWCGSLLTLYQALRHS